MFSQPANEFEQRPVIDSGLTSARHLVTDVGVDHPGRNGLPDLGIAEIQVLHIPAAHSTQNREVPPTEERVKWIANRNLALVTGIIACRLGRDDYIEIGRLFLEQCSRGGR